MISVSEDFGCVRGTAEQKKRAREIAKVVEGAFQEILTHSPKILHAVKYKGSKPDGDTPFSLKVERINPQGECYNPKNEENHVPVFCCLNIWGTCNEGERPSFPILSLLVDEEGKIRNGIAEHGKNSGNATLRKPEDPRDHVALPVMECPIDEKLTDLAKKGDDKKLGEVILQRYAEDIVKLLLARSLQALFVNAGNSRLGKALAKLDGNRQAVDFGCFRPR